jgi:hypothetical protein
LPAKDELEMKPVLQRDLETTIQQSRSGGQPFADSIRQGRSMQAKAFTTGHHIFFRQGSYEPGSIKGQEYPRTEAKSVAAGPRASLVLGDKSVDGESDSRFGLVEDNGPDAGIGPKKRAGIDYFVVRWIKNPKSGPKTAKLGLVFTARFTKDATHDPAVAEFRQNAYHTFKVTDGYNKGWEDNNGPPVHDDGYSRKDDKVNSINGDSLLINDNPGTENLAKNDVLDYSFTAEQMIIDTGDNNKVIAKLGPHTATIKGKHPRTYAGVPKALQTGF